MNKNAPRAGDQPAPIMPDRFSSAPRLRSAGVAWLRLALGTAALWALLALPHGPAGFDAAAMLIWPVGLPVVVAALALCRGRVFTALLSLICVVAAAILLLKLADTGTEAAFQRPFNPLLDGWLLSAGWHLLVGTVGMAKALGALALGLLAWLAWTALIAWGLAGLKHIVDRPPIALVAGGLAAGGVAALLVATAQGAVWPVEASLADSLVNRVALVRRDYAEMAAFSKTISPDPIADIAPKRRLSALAGQNVVLIFVESYGRSAVAQPRYAQIIDKRLAAIDTKLQQAGRHVLSGWLKSPTVGGGSWFAHGALLSGLWTNSQARYDRMIVSKRASLNQLFRRAGWRTVAVMPQITQAWPQARYFGYDAVYADGELGYKGKSFNWIRMPDQYTLWRIHKRIAGAPTQPVMLETALVSSHAPWVPVPHMVPWAKIGDGTIFNPQAERGDPPAVVWRDPARVRRQYVKAVDYSLQAVGRYMARFGDDTVFIVLGDHQPAALVTGQGVSRQVPTHIVADDPAVLKRLVGWGWTAAMKPAPNAPVMRMDRFRQRFVRAMSGDGTG